MPYVTCTSCRKSVHFTVKDVKSFHEKYVEGNEPIYCFDCFKKTRPDEKKENKE